MRKPTTSIPPPPLTPIQPEQPSESVCVCEGARKVESVCSHNKHTTNGRKNDKMKRINERKGKTIRERERGREPKRITRRRCETKKERPQTE